MSAPPLDIEPGQTPTAVYRCYDSQGTLLYVGMTDQVRVRLNTHERDAAWWPQGGSHQVAWYPSRRDALDAEAAAIIAEKPLHNIRRRPARTPAAKRPAPRRVHAASNRPLRHNGYFIRAMREKCDLTQAELAEMAGIDRGFLSHLESETRPSSARTLTKLAHAMSVSVAAILRDPNVIIVDPGSGVSGLVA